MMASEVYINAHDDGTSTITSCANDKSIIVKADGFKLAMAFQEYNAGCLIQDAFDFLNAEERDFLLTGMTPDEQARFYNNLEEDVSMGTEATDE